jgi:hypothetical protein
VEFLERRGDQFLIEANWDIHVPVDVRGWIAFTGVLVRVDDTVFGDRLRAFDIPDGAEELPAIPEADQLNAEIKAAAQDAVGKHFALEDFGAPEIRKFSLVWFPLSKDRIREQ